MAHYLVIWRSGWENSQAGPLLAMTGPRQSFNLYVDAAHLPPKKTPPEGMLSREAKISTTPPTNTEFFVESQYHCTKLRPLVIEQTITRNLHSDGGAGLRDRLFLFRQPNHRLRDRKRQRITSLRSTMLMLLSDEVCQLIIDRTIFFDIGR